MRTLLTLAVLIAFQTGLSQPKKVQVREELLKVPNRTAKSPVKLAQFLTENDSSDFQKAFNIYSWIIHNIKYDLKSLHKNKGKRSPVQTLKRKKGICYQYSALFVALCQNAGISAKEIIGYSRGAIYHEDLLFYEEDHSWNGVKLDSAWYLVDATFGSGHLRAKKMWWKKLMLRLFKKPYVQNKYKFIKAPSYQYFLVDPQTLIADHLPTDPYWQLLEYPISPTTFESNVWQEYEPRLDSMYQKQMDSIDYLRRLNSYEYLSDLQYLQVTGKRSAQFNTRNSATLGESLFALGFSYEHSHGNMEQKEEAYRQAVQHYRQASTRLKQHQSSAKAASSRMIRISKTRISRELTKPISNRLSRNTREYKRAARMLTNESRTRDGHQNRVERLEKINARPFGTFMTPDSARIAKWKLVEKNKAKIESLWTRVLKDKDSVEVLIANLMLHEQQFQPTQELLIRHYPLLRPLLRNVSQSINENRRMSHITSYMQEVSLLGQYLDSLAEKRSNLEKAMAVEKRTIRQLQRAIASNASQVRKLIIQNCQYSKNKVCEGPLYNKASYALDSVYQSQLEMERAYLTSLEKNGQINRKMVETSKEVQGILEINVQYNELFEKNRIGKIYFRLGKSTKATGSLLKECQEGIQRVNTKMTALKRQILKDKAAENQSDH